MKWRWFLFLLVLFAAQTSVHAENDYIFADSLESTKVLEVYVDTVIQKGESVSSNGVTVTATDDLSSSVEISSAINRFFEPVTRIAVNGGNVTIDFNDQLTRPSNEIMEGASVTECPRIISNFPVDNCLKNWPTSFASRIEYDGNDIEDVRLPNGSTTLNESDLDGTQREYELHKDFRDGSRLYGSLCAINSDCKGEPVLLIHGFQPENFIFGAKIEDNGGDDYWGSFPQRLIDDGLNPYEFIWLTNARFQDVAVDLSKAIERIKADTGKDVHIVGHSFGGVLTRRLLQDTDTNQIASSIASVTTIGSPQNGIFDNKTIFVGRIDDKVISKTFPKGQDDVNFEFCNQISCHLMGEKLKLLESAIAKLLDVDSTQGTDAYFLATTTSNLPALNIQSLIGLQKFQGTDLITGGDGLISGEGQRFLPNLVFTDDDVPKWDIPIGNLSEGMGDAHVSEFILGRHSKNDPDLYIEPHIIIDLENFVPFIHSTGTAKYFHWDFDEIEPVVHLTGFHDVYQRTAVWIALNSSDVQTNALVALYNSTHGDNWTDNTNWLIGDPCANNWFGVTCDGDSNIETIIMGNNNLVGTIPVELGNLNNLKWLSLFDNQLSGSIPVELGNLTKLIRLYLEDNQLTGSIPVALGNLTNLGGLNLSSNQLTSSIPIELDNLTNLGTLDLRWNGLHTSDSSLDAFLDTKSGEDWSTTQTIPPTNVFIDSVTDQSVTLSWDAIEYTGDTGRYTIWCRTDEFSTYRDCGSTANKSTTSLEVTNLLSSITYYFTVSTATNSHAYNQNMIVSDPSEEISAFTSNDVTITGLNASPNSVTVGGSTTISWTTQNALSCTPSGGTGGWDTSTIQLPNGSASITIAAEGTYDFTLTCEDALGGSDERNVVVTAVDPRNLERNALVALYNSTDGENWTDNTNWLVGDPCTDSWFGLTCNGNSNIEEIYLYDNNLVGTIPVQLGNLPNLKFLYLDYNQLTGSIPVELSNLTHLQDLSLWFNELTGSIPPELSNLPHLISLDLGHNQLTSAIPFELGNLSSLELLYLNDNELTGSIPIELGDLTNLQYLGLWNNQLTGSIPVELGNLTNLQDLGLDTNMLTGSIVAELGNLVELYHLSLSNNHLTGNIPAELGSIINLQQLWLSNNRLTGHIPIELANLTKLYSLYLDRNILTGSIPIVLGGLTNLSQIGLNWNALYTSDVALDAFLDSKSSDWSKTQTVPPANVTISGITGQSITLSWDEIEYTNSAGRYRVWYSTVLGGPYSDGGSTINKTTTSQEVTGLSSAATYYFMVRTETDSHFYNQNDLISDPSKEVSATTFGEVLTERDALVTLYYSTNGHNWANNTNWLVGDPCANNWFGVVCDGNSIIEQVSLSSNNLLGMIPPELGVLSNLKALHLNNNKLTGGIPFELGILTNLEELFLGSNHLTGNIPVELGNLTNLLDLSLNWNGLYASDSSLDAFLDSASGNDWSVTQTVPPASVTIGGVTYQSAILSWDAIEYIGNTGRYRVWCSIRESGPYSDCGTTVDKNTTSLEVNGLSPLTTYFFVVRSETDNHINNQNDLVSDSSEEASATTIGNAPALKHGDIIVVDFDKRSLLKLDPDSGLQTTISKNGFLLRPSDTAIDENGDLVVADYEASVIRVNPQTGVQAIVSSGGLLVHPHGITVEKNGDLLVSDDSAFGLAGGIIRVNPVTGSQEEVSSGNFFRDPQKHVINNEGQIVLAEGTAGGGGFNGSIIIIDPQTGAQSILSARDHFVTPLDVAIDVAGNLYVAEGYSKIVRVDPVTGNQILISSGGLLTTPSGIDVDVNGDLLVADAGTRTIIRIDTVSGTQTLVSSVGFTRPSGLTVIRIESEAE